MSVVSPLPPDTLRRGAGGELTGHEAPGPSELPSRVRIPTGEASSELRARGSRFLAGARRADDRASALAFREEERRRFHDATHHVFAVRLLDGSLHFDDDGEPSGTAGRPVASALERAGLRNAAVVVTRWFGGTKLGTGGLARAYGDAAAAVLDGLPVALAAPGRRVSVAYPYDETGAVMRVVEASGARRRRETWGEEAAMELLVPGDQLEALERALRDATAGRCTVGIMKDTVLVPIRSGP